MGAVDIKTLLKDELLQRRTAQGQYSVRQFATDISVSPAQLSKVLSGKSTLSENKIFKIGRILKWPALTVQRLIIQVKNSSGNRQLTALNKTNEKMVITDIQKESFKVISDWYHFAILELMHLSDFSPKVDFIANRLGLAEDVVAKAIDRLIQLKFIEIQSDGSWVDISRFTTTLNSFDTDLAMRQYQIQLLNMASRAVENVDINQRSQTAITFAVSKKKIQEAKQKIIAFQRALVTSLKADADPNDEVYQLTISLFPLTTLAKVEKND